MKAHNCSHWVYVLLLENGAFYVGATSNLRQRLHAHMLPSSRLSAKPSLLYALYQFPSRKLAFFHESSMKYLASIELRNKCAKDGVVVSINMKEFL
jgi:predicted GIY-YIG superfamily endonuclease